MEQPLFTKPKGYQGWSSASVQTVREAPEYLYTSSGFVAWAIGATSVITGVAGESIRILGGYWTPSSANTIFALSASELLLELVIE